MYHFCHFALFSYNDIVMLDMVAIHMPIGDHMMLDCLLTNTICCATNYIHCHLFITRLYISTTYH